MGLFGMMKFHNNDEDFLDKASKHPESVSDRPGERGPVDDETTYNDPGMDEALIGGQDNPKEFENLRKPGGAYINVEDLPAEDYEEALIARIDASLQEEMKDAGPDPYGYRELVSSLFASFDRSPKKQEEINKEINALLPKINGFFKEYKEILSQGLEDDKEKAAVQAAFDRHVGKIAYIDAGRREVLPSFVQVRKARPGQDRGFKVTEEKRKPTRFYQSGRPARGDKDAAREERDIKEGAGLRVYNPATGRYENYKK